MEPFFGEVKYFAGNYAPIGWAFCEGQLMSIAENQALFSLLGDSFGGDARVSFALPKIEDLNGCKAIIAITGIYPARS